ncbi:MAG: hypothetical protein GTO24_05240 [candidate division Zixibacteria bacterium]|nr:hypothetical protein [candidate division Zixibacteria bacterium]
MKTLKQHHFFPPKAEDKLRHLFRRVYKEHPFYRHIFEETKLNPDDDPISVLNRLPVLDRTDYLGLQRDIFSRLKGAQFLTERSSGTTGPRKIRFVTQRDEAAEEELCFRFFRQCGLTPSDRVLAIDVDSPEIYLFYSRALLRMGIRDFSYVNYTDSGHEALKPIFTFRPTAIFSVPSVVSRCRAELERASGPDGQGHLKKVVYIAENMSPELRRTLCQQMGLEVFSFYGSTEIGSMAGECEKHEGIHLFNDAVVPTVIDPADDGGCITGQVAWTTLHFTDQPLIKYVNGDIVSVAKNECTCGRHYPLMTEVSRVDDIFTIYGQKFRYHDFERVIRGELGSIKSLKIIITSEAKRDRVIFQVPDYLVKERDVIIKAVRLIDDFHYFLKMGFVVTQIEADSGYEVVKRKSNRVVDLRGEVSPQRNRLSYGRVAVPVDGVSGRHERREVDND